MSIFRGDLFGGAAGLGRLPSRASLLASLSRWRGMFPQLPGEAQLREQGVTHYTTEVVGSSQQHRFEFYAPSGRRLGEFVYRLLPGSLNVVATPSDDPLPLHQEDDGLLPAPVEVETSSWAPWAAGAALLGVAWLLTRKPQRVTANRRRRRTTRKRR